ncbi:MAG: acyloxyacyl hydrolase [Bacteroidetes bacterium]|nr:acyloxyacyl hydrolase [Bacteroidota bacterium]
MEIYNSHFPAIEISLGKATYGQQFWEQMYSYPDIGIVYYHSGLGISPYLGTANALFPYINFPIIKTKTITIGFRLGAGIGYLTKKFERLENFKHLAIGSHINFAGNLMLELNYRLNDFYWFTAGLTLTHFSNGSFKLPNYGLNVPAISIGLQRFFNRQNVPIQKRLYSPTKPFDFDIHRIIEFNLTGVFGFKDLQALVGKKFFVYSLFGTALKQISYKSKFGGGFDVSYDGSDEKILEKNHVIVENKFSLIKTGLNIAYQLALGKLAFDFNYGMYLSGKDQSDGSVYQKVSIKYDFSEHLYANITLKVHWGRADFIGWGMGYKIKWYY